MAYYDSIYEDQELSHRAKSVYIYLKDHANRECTCWPGINSGHKKEFHRCPQ